MEHDPFSSNNPFGSDTQSPKGEVVPAHQDPLQASSQEPSPSHAQPAQPKEDLFFDDDPFAAPRPSFEAVSTSASNAAQGAAAQAQTAANNASHIARVASVAAVVAPESNAGQIHTAAKAASSLLRGAASMAGSAASKLPLGTDSSAADATAGVSVPQGMSFDDWKAHALDLGPRLEGRTVAERRELAIAYAAEKKIRIESSVLRDADTELGVVKLCKHLRLAPSGVPYSACSRVEMEGAQRNPGKGMEFPFWTYTFKVYTLLDDYKGQPHHDGQAEDDYNTIHSLVMVRVTRRYRDFEWLRKCLVAENPSVLVPPVPEKTLQSMKEKLGKKGESFQGKELENSGYEKGAWQNDDDAVRCNLCGTNFSMFVRKHHCRHCHMIFCSTCCPKPTGGQRFCKDCGSLKGLSEMLMKNPDVAFRMRELQLFLQECFNSPLADSETLRLFIEAPPYLLAERKDSITKRIENAQAVKLSYGDAAKEKISSVQSWISTGHAANVSEQMAGVSPRGQERKRIAMRAWTMVEGFKVFRDQIATQLFEGLSRKRGEIPAVNSPYAGDADLRALKFAAEQSESALATFSSANKEAMFAMIATFNFLIGLLQSMLSLLNDVERANKQRSSAGSNPGKLQTLNDYLNEMEIAIQRESRWLNNHVATCFKTVMCQLWNVEARRDPNDYNWAALSKTVAAMKDPY